MIRLVYVYESRPCHSQGSDLCMRMNLDDPAHSQGSDLRMRMNLDDPAHSQGSDLCMHTNLWKGTSKQNLRHLLASKFYEHRCYCDITMK